ncbi:MAG: hypothetical protein D6729_11450, partial [Deltaproteobacteria bacterium]
MRNTTRRLRRFVLTGLGLLPLLGSGCATLRPSPFGAGAVPEAALRAAAQSAQHPKSASDLAQAGWLALYHASDVATAEGRFERALALDPSEAWAHFGLAEIARSRVRIRVAAAHYLDLLERAPAHPLAELTARRLASLLGSEASPETLERIAAVRQAPGVAAPARPVLAAALARLLELKGRFQEARALRESSGGPPRMVVAGPFSRYRALDAERL